MDHLECSNILADYQHGFWQKRSHETQFIITIEEISRYLKKKQAKKKDVILDFSKTYDTVPHNRHLHKLDNYGGKGNIHGWLQSWLTTRQQKVLEDGNESASVHVKSGVTQGTVLGSFMLLLYINDIKSSIK